MLCSSHPAATRNFELHKESKATVGASEWAFGRSQPEIGVRENLPLLPAGFWLSIVPAKPLELGLFSIVLGTLALPGAAASHQAVDVGSQRKELR